MATQSSSGNNPLDISDQWSDIEDDTSSVNVTPTASTVASPICSPVLGPKLDTFWEEEQLTTQIFTGGLATVLNPARACLAKFQRVATDCLNAEQFLDLLLKGLDHNKASKCARLTLMLQRVLKEVAYENWNDCNMIMRVRVLARIR